MKFHLFQFTLIILFTNQIANAQFYFRKVKFDETESPSSSASFVDVNNDGFLDIFVTSGEVQFDNYLYINNRDSTFSKSTSEDIIKKDQSNSFSGAWGDFDNDGDLDVFVSNSDYAKQIGQPCYLIENVGNGNFQKTTDNVLSKDINPGSYGATWGDYDNDGWLDLFMSNAYGKSVLYKNLSNGDFQKITNLPEIQNTDVSIHTSWIDYNNDGCQDLYILNLGKKDNNILLKNNCNGTFSSIKNTLATLGNFQYGNSRSVNWSDLDRDGDMDAIVVDRENYSIFIFKNNGGDDFTLQMSYFDAYRSSSTFDLNNDGWDDIITIIDNGLKCYINKGNMNFLEISTNILPDSVFSESTPFCISSGDYDNDGKVDAFIACRFKRFGGNAKDILLKNISKTCNNWLTISFNQSGNNKFAIGGKVWCYFKEKSQNVITYKQILTTHSGNYQSYSGQYVNFGLGTEKVVDSIKVLWPNGKTTKHFNIKANQKIELFDDGQITFGNPPNLETKDTLKILSRNVTVGCQKIVTYLYFTEPVDWYEEGTNKLLVTQNQYLMNIDSTRSYYFRTLCERSETFNIPKFQKQNCTNETQCILEKVKIPNIITPNNDGLNDQFKIDFQNSEQKTIELTIYNRWGSKIFENMNYQNEWTADSESDGNYFYVIKMKGLDYCFTKGIIEVRH